MAIIHRRTNENDERYAASISSLPEMAAVAPPLPLYRRHNIGRQEAACFVSVERVNVIV